MLELYTASLAQLAKDLLQAIDKEPRVIHSPSQDLDFTLAKRKFKTQDSDVLYTNYLPFAAIQLMQPPEWLPRAQPNQPGFSAVKYPEEGVYVKVSTSLVRIRYYIRFYCKSFVEQAALAEAFVLNFPREVTTATLRVPYFEDVEVIFAIRFEPLENFREISNADQYQLYVLGLPLTTEGPVFGREGKVRKLMLRPFIDYNYEDPADFAPDVAYED